MMPYQTYRLYQIERPKTAAEIRIETDHAGRTAAAIAGALRRLTQAAMPRPAERDRAMDPATPRNCDRVIMKMEVR